MLTALRVLILEDRGDDAELMLQELRRAGFDPNGQIVETESDYLAHLDPQLDVILADYSLHQFDARRALHLLQKRGLDIPFIIVSGFIGEELAVECMKDGAADYLLKDRLGRLGHAVTHALAQKRLCEEKRDAEDALRESQRTLSTLMSNLPGMVYRRFQGPSWAFIYASEGSFPLTGYRPSECIQKRFTYAQLINPDDNRSVLNEVQAALQARRPFQVEYRIRTATGQEKWVWERGRGVFTPEGQLLHVEGFLTDITERKRAEKEKATLAEQLRVSQKLEAVGQLAGGIAHDFNNLLTVITGYSQLLLLNMGPDDPSRDEIDQIQKAGERAAALTRQLLAFSRKQVLSPEVLDLNAVVANVEKLLRRLIGEDITLVTALASVLGSVKADPGQLEQVIMNLAVNARDAMPQGGRLILETKNVELDAAYAYVHDPVLPGSYVLLAVSDTGCGMDKATQARIFEPFFTTKDPGKGTGLGLATVYGIVKQSGGYIWVYSEPGMGTSFIIYLPRVTAAQEDAPAAPAPAAAPGGSEAILLVEDEDMVRELARKVLHTNGYTVLAARDGPEALRLSQAHPAPIALLMTDVVMPRMSGRELADGLAAVRPETKVLYMSGYTDTAIVAHGVLDPGIAFLQKPFTPDDLARKVREVLDTNR